MKLKHNSQEFRDLYEERAAIIEYDAGESRELAEHKAYLETMIALNGTQQHKT